MDINALGIQHLNSAYVPFSSAAAQAAPGTGNDFSELLRRSQSARASSQDAGVHAAPVLKKTAIDKTDKLYELCVELETFLVKNLIKSMRSTVQKTNLIDTGFAGEIYEDMLYDEYAKGFAKNANLGFAEMAYRELAAYSR